MSTALTLHPQTTAVLCMDMQASIVHVYKQHQPDIADRAKAVLEASRAAGLRVIYVQVGFRPNFPEISERNPLFGSVKASPQYQQIFQGAAAEIHASVRPEPGEVVVTKHRISAFTGTDLEMILRAQGITTLVLFGIATSGVVLSTLVDAADADYRLVVVQDCCADRDTALHSALTERYFPSRGTVVSAAEFLTLVTTEPPSNGVSEKT